MTEESGGDRQKECHSVTSDSRGMTDEYGRTSGYECPAGAELGRGWLKFCQTVAVNDECGWQRMPKEATSKGQRRSTRTVNEETDVSEETEAYESYVNLEYEAYEGAESMGDKG
ncbi:hypothetical protein GN958_ATG08004 [Phytophthora infestans]|uniref:Uncharacterized protein n=1 Tax=Phytophthora infestans TaxID=4787 RepID=A0A8S9UPI5_PHYIN|nr:hypothetical protein GN958_ATG08004 [Phytophthora infestans]